MKKMKKLSVLLLALVMVFTLLPMGVVATNVDSAVGLYQIVTIQNEVLLDSSLISPLGQIMCCPDMDLVTMWISHLNGFRSVCRFCWAVWP